MSHSRQFGSFFSATHFLFSHGAPPPFKHIGHWAAANHSSPFLNSVNLKDFTTCSTQLYLTVSTSLFNSAAVNFTLPFPFGH